MSPSWDQPILVFAFLPSPLLQFLPSLGPATIIVTVLGTAVLRHKDLLSSKIQQSIYRAAVPGPAINNYRAAVPGPALYNYCAAVPGPALFNYHDAVPVTVRHPGTRSAAP